MLGDFGPVDGAVLHIKDVTITGSPGCGNSAVNLPMPTLELLRVDVTASGMTFNPCTVTIRDSKIRQSSGTSLMTLDGETAGVGGATMTRGTVLTMDRSWIERGDPAFNVLANSGAHITNSVFLNQGTNVGLWISYTNALQTSSLEFSTLYNTILKCGTLAGIGFLTSKNNIYYNTASGAPADTVTGTQCTHSYDLVFPQATAPSGPGNIVAAPSFVNRIAADFHLMSDSPAIDHADPAATEMIDYDGTARPQGAARDIGAFEYKP
jgi:hypothetical protein